MKSVNKILLLVATILLAISFTSCSKDKKDTEEKGETDDKEVVNYGSYTFDGATKEIKKACVDVYSSTLSLYLFPEVIDMNQPEEPEEYLFFVVKIDELGNSVNVPQLSSYFTKFGDKGYDSGQKMNASGSFKLNGDGKKYTAEFDITFEDGKTLSGEYGGIPEIRDKSTSEE
jgi:hypothetical protein